VETIPPPPSSGVRLRGPLPPAQLRRIIATYFPLVQRLVKQLLRRLPANVQEDDLISAGVSGLVDSLRRNGGDHGVTFPCYARTRIRGAIFDELRAQDWLSRRARDRLTAASEAGSATVVLVSLDEVTGNEATHHLAVAEDDPLEAAESHWQQRALARAIEQLPERERRIVGRHYFDGVKLKDISTELGVSEPRISQLHTRALGRLRGLLGRGQSPPKSLARPVSGASIA
jgi:RNA polymerase sigma factor FliA